MQCAGTIGLGIQCPAYASPGHLLCVSCGEAAAAPATGKTKGEDPKQCWRTTRVGGRHVVREFNLNHDAAADAHNTLCPTFWSFTDSALDRFWPVELRIFCNPPFKRASEFATRHLTHKEHGGASLLLCIDRGAQWLEAVRKQTRWWLFSGRVEYEPPPGVPAGDGVGFASVLLFFERTQSPGFQGWRDPNTFVWTHDAQGRPRDA